MKRLYLYLLILTTTSSITFAQITSNCTPSAPLIKAYANDVTDLAFERIYQIKSPDTALIEIPQRYKDTIMAALAAVCNLDTQYQADSVFLRYCVHRYPAHPFMSPSITVKVDTAYAWAKQWYLGNNTTGNAALDNFLTLHHVKLTGYFCISSYEYLNNRATLSPQGAINMKAFGDSLLNFPGVIYYERNFPYGDGDRVYYSKDTAVHFTFIAGRGDCPSGCTEAKTWKYSVSPDCTVTLDTVYSSIRGNPYLPNCNLAPLAIKPTAQLPQQALNIYPNPASKAIHLSNPATTNLTYHIVDITGRTLLQGTIKSNQINIESLQPGIYTLVVNDEHGTQSSNRKFRKE